jgi:Rrf2 family protein
MSNVLKMSNAVAMAIHAMVLLADRPGQLMSTHEIAVILDVSEAHLSKVLQRLTKSNLLVATRGPKGGFGLAPGMEEASLLQVYEVVEGPLASDSCILSSPICGGKHCVFGDLLVRLNREVRDYLGNTRLKDVTEVCRSIT